MLIKEVNEKIKLMKGFFEEQDMYLFDFLLEGQAKENIWGNLGEFGIYYGKSLSKLCQYADMKQKIFCADYPITDEEQKRDIISNIKSVSLVQTKNIVFSNIDVYAQNEAVSQDLFNRNIRFMHLDASFAGIDVYRELEEADKMMTREGILVLTNFGNKLYSGVTEAYYKYVSLHPGSFKLFMCSDNKGYFCRAYRHHTMLWNTETRLREFFNRIEYPLKVTMAKTCNSIDGENIIVTGNDVTFNEPVCYVELPMQHI